MVKNKTGGNRHKKMARKNVNMMARKPKIRISKDECEVYAKVMVMYGNGMCDVLCNDGITRMLIIRRKFKGRNRRDNQVKINNLVLVGIREWEVISQEKKAKVDLLYIYSQSQAEELVKENLINSRIIPDSIIEEVVDENTIEFVRHGSIINEDENKVELKIVEKEKTLDDKKGGEEEIVWDDI
jgi:initiation factor 1A